MPFIREKYASLTDPARDEYLIEFCDANSLRELISVVSLLDVIKAARFAVYVAIIIWQKNQNPITNTRPANVPGVLSGPKR